MSTICGRRSPTQAASPTGSAKSRASCASAESSAPNSSASGWHGTGRVEACEPPQRLLVLTKDTEEPEAPDEHPIELTLTADGDETALVCEERAIPLDQLAAYGAGVQVHVEDL